MHFTIFFITFLALCCLKPREYSNKKYFAKKSNRYYCDNTMFQVLLKSIEYGYKIQNYRAEKVTLKS